ncbi:MAG: hypothetical protein HC854_01075 [Flavobacterium sp.]|nr:hypothetical protein [Flavobacterium sp.]
MQLSSRVDKSSKEINEVVNLYENYLNSNPEIISDNPFWNKKEKELYKDFDFSRESMFQGGMTAKDLFSLYEPFIMSVEPIGEKYQIRIMFSLSNASLEYVGSKVWCIHKLNAIQENQKWVLENLIVEISKDWKTEKHDFIAYILPDAYNLDKEQVKLSTLFCEDIIKRFNPKYNSSLNFISQIPLMKWVC